MTIVEDARVITGGVDTRAGVRVAAAPIPSAGCRRPGVPGHRGRVRGSAQLAGRVRYRRPGRGRGAGGYGAGLARRLAVAGIRVVEAARPAGPPPPGQA